jgi:hypothetical protein
LENANMKANTKKPTRPTKSVAVSKRPVQISLDQRLLRRVDADEETKAEGRSAFMVNAILLYLREKERRQIDAEIHGAYGGKADELYAESAPLMTGQLWPPEDDLVEGGAAPARGRAGRGRHGK